MSEERRQLHREKIVEQSLASGMSMEEIEQRLTALPNDNPDKEAIVMQYLLKLPEGEREVAKNRIFGS